MGSPVSPILANIVLADLEELIIASLLDYKPILYKRYVDDIFMIIPESKIEYTLNIFNSVNPLIQFTCEKIINNKINFLDLTVIIDENSNKIITNWYRKENSSDRLLNYHSIQPLHQKRGIIYNLIYRAMILSDSRFYDENIKIVINLLLDNNYPIRFIRANIQKRLKTIELSETNKKIWYH